MYHGIAAGALPANGHRVHVTRAAFAEQMSWLRSEGYRPVSLAELDEQTNDDSDVRPRVAITFDDGFRSALTLAAPILQAHGFTATAFVVSDWAEGATAREGHRPSLRPAGADLLHEDQVMSWPEVAQLRDAGWDIGSHTCSHADCSALTADALARELRESRALIMERLGVVPQALAYPRGRYCAGAVALARAYYRAAYAVHPGRSVDARFAFRRHRIEINAADTLARFRAKVLTGHAGRGERLRSAVRDQLFGSLRLHDALVNRSTVPT